HGQEIETLCGSLRQHVMWRRGIAGAEVACPAQRTPHSLVATIERDLFARHRQRQAAPLKGLRRRSQEAMAHVRRRRYVRTWNALQRKAGRRVKRAVEG